MFFSQDLYYWKANDKALNVIVNKFCSHKEVSVYNSSYFITMRLNRYSKIQHYSYLFKFANEYRNDCIS